MPSQPLWFYQGKLQRYKTTTKMNGKSPHYNIRTGTNKSLSKKHFQAAICFLWYLQTGITCTQCQYRIWCPYTELQELSFNQYQWKSNILLRFCFGCRDTDLYQDLLKIFMFVKYENRSNLFVCLYLLTIMKSHNERVVDICQDVSLHLRPLTITNCKQ